MSPVNALVVHSAVISNAARAPMYARPNHSSGADSSSVSRVRGERVSHAERRRRVPALGSAPATSLVMVSALDLRPRPGPGGVVGALDVGAAVQALRDGSVPVEDLLGVRGVRGVVGRAVRLVGGLLARLLVRRRLAEVL